jgi:hypothetical protein
MLRRVLIAAVLLASCLGSHAEGQGQPGPAPPARFQPSRPTISPYLNLLRRDVGPLPNYYSLVRPQLNQIEFDQRQRVINAQQQGQIQQNSRQILSISESTAAPTGTGSVYRNYGHYYPGIGR